MDRCVATDPALSMSRATPGPKERTSDERADLPRQQWYRRGCSPHRLLRARDLQCHRPWVRAHRAAGSIPSGEDGPRSTPSRNHTSSMPVHSTARTIEYGTIRAISVPSPALLRYF